MEGLLFLLERSMVRYHCKEAADKNMVQANFQDCAAIIHTVKNVDSHPQVSRASRKNQVVVVLLAIIPLYHHCYSTVLYIQLVNKLKALPNVRGNILQ